MDDKHAAQLYFIDTVFLCLIMNNKYNETVKSSPRCFDIRLFRLLINFRLSVGVGDIIDNHILDNGSNPSTDWCVYRIIIEVAGRYITLYCNFVSLDLYIVKSKYNNTYYVLTNSSRLLVCTYLSILWTNLKWKLTK